MTRPDITNGNDAGKAYIDARIKKIATQIDLAKFTRRKAYMHGRREAEDQVVTPTALVESQIGMRELAKGFRDGEKERRLISGEE